MREFVPSLDFWLLHLSQTSADARAGKRSPASPTAIHWLYKRLYILLQTLLYFEAYYHVICFYGNHNNLATSVKLDQSWNAVTITLRWQNGGFLRWSVGMAEVHHFSCALPHPTENSSKATDKEDRASTKADKWMQTMLWERSSSSSNVSFRKTHQWYLKKKSFLLLWLKDCYNWEKEKKEIWVNGISADGTTFLDLSLSTCKLGKSTYKIHRCMFENAVCKSDNGATPLISAGSRRDP